MLVSNLILTQLLNPIKVYLRQLPLLSARPLSRSHSSFSAISRVGSFTTISPLSVHPNSAPPEPAPGNNGKENPPPRPLLPASSIELLMRNIEEILDLHEHFVQELRQAVLPCGLATALDHHADSERRFPESYEHIAPEVEVAINAVCTKFATEASVIFLIYFVMSDLPTPSPPDLTRINHSVQVIRKR